jgi:hypothetical protein
MKRFTSDCWGKLHDHNGVIGGSDRAPIEYAVEILNEQQRQIEGLLEKVDRGGEQSCHLEISYHDILYQAIKSRLKVAK